MGSHGSDMDRSHTAPFFWLEPVCTVGLSVPVWDRSRTDPLSCVQDLILRFFLDFIEQFDGLILLKIEALSHQI